MRAEAKVVESGVVQRGDLFYAGVVFKIPKQGGYDRSDEESMIRPFDNEADAEAWLQHKLAKVESRQPDRSGGEGGL